MGPWEGQRWDIRGLKAPKCKYPDRSAWLPYVGCRDVPSLRKLLADLQHRTRSTGWPICQFRRQLGYSGAKALLQHARKRALISSCVAITDDPPNKDARRDFLSGKGSLGMDCPVNDGLKKADIIRTVDINGRGI